ncbi:hypothetical protein Tco_1191444 [Tanacetum coccineum]
MGVNILKSIDEGPFKMGKFRETLAEGALHLGAEWDRVFADLTPEEKERFKADIYATNILLQGLPKDIYTLINHYTNAKDNWDNVKMLLEGSEFTKLINDMRYIKMAMPKMQLNSKFVNNVLPEWGRFMTTVKLNRGLKQSNYDQLYAYLKQYEAHANENKMMLERYNQHAIDPLAFVSNVLPQQYPTQSSTIPQSAYVPQVTHQPHFADNTHLDSGLTPTDDLIENLTKIGRHNRGQRNYAKGAVAVGNGGVQNRTNTFDDDVDEAPVQDLALNKDNVFQANQCDAFDSDVDESLTAQTMFMVNLSSADPIYDEAGPSYDSNILSEVQDHDNYVDSVGEYHEVHEMQNDVQPNYVVDLDAEYTSDSNIIPSRFKLTEREQNIDEQMRIIIRDRNVLEELLKKELHSVKMQLNSTINHTKLIKEEVTTLKRDFKQKENKYLEDFLDMKALKEKSALYNGHEIVKTNHTPAIMHDSEDTLEIAEKTRIGMLEKMKSTLWVDKQARCLELEVEISKLKHMIQKDDHSEIIKHFSNLEIDHLNLQLKYQNLKESFRNNKSQTSQDAPEFGTVFKINKMKASLQGKDNAIKKLKDQISQMNERCSEADRILNFKALDFQNIELTKKVTTLQEQNKLFRAENEKVKQHYKELYDSIKITHAKTIEKTTYLLTENEKVKA